MQMPEPFGRTDDVSQNGCSGTPHPSVEAAQTECPSRDRPGPSSRFRAVRDSLHGQHVHTTIGQQKEEFDPGPGHEWIIHFREEMKRFEQQELGRGMRIKYPYVVPKHMKVLKESAYSPQGHLHLGLNLRCNATKEEDQRMTRLKANWANNYIRWRLRIGGVLIDSRASSDYGSTAEALAKGWHDFVQGLDIDVDAAVECYELGFHYVPDQHKELFKEMLAVDALFLVIYLLYLSGELPMRGFSWLVHDPQFKAANSHSFLHDLFLLENQIPLRVVEVVVQDFCKWKSLRGRPEEEQARPNIEFKEPAQMLMKTLVLAAVDRRLRMVFPTTTPQLASLQVVYERRSLQAGHNGPQRGHEEVPVVKPFPQSPSGSATGTRNTELVCVVDIGLCDHLLDCLLEAICTQPESRKGDKNKEQDEEGIAKILAAGNGTPIASSAQSQGWGFSEPGNFSSIYRVESEGSHGFHDVYKLTAAQGCSDVVKQEILESMVCDGEGSGYVGLTPIDPDDLSKKADRLCSYANGSLRAVDSIREHCSSGTSVRLRGEGSYNELIGLISQLLTVVSTGSREYAYSAEANLLGRNFDKVKGRLDGAFQQVDVALRPTLRLGNAPWDRVVTYYLILKYFAEVAALLEALDELAYYEVRGTELFLLDVTANNSGSMLDVVLDGLAARGYTIETQKSRNQRKTTQGSAPRFADSTAQDTSASQRRVTSTANSTTPDGYKAEYVECATRLKRVGITLGVCNAVKQIHLQNKGTSVLMLPRLTIDDGADALFRNLAVWERIKTAGGITPFACFIMLLDNLIDTPDDVAVMRAAGVLVHHLGSDAAVANMVNDLVVGLSSYASEAWANMLHQLNVRTKDTTKQYWAEFKDNYFSRPWHTTATLAATLLLFLTLGQTIFAGMQV